MKKLIICLICMLLICSAACADMTPSRTAITIDGVRVAFFSASGDYLQPLEENGTVWVPADALGENLGMSITADSETNSVFKDGIRVAVFDTDGNYLAPITVDGIVYVPLIPFAESIGIECDVSDKTIALSRTVSESTGNPAELMTETTEKPPEYVWIP